MASAQVCWCCMVSKKSREGDDLQKDGSCILRGAWVDTKRLGLFGKIVIFFQLCLRTPRFKIMFLSSACSTLSPYWGGTGGQVTVSLSLVMQQLLPANGLGKHLSLQPEFVGVVEVLGELQPLPQHALQAAVLWRKLRVLRFVVPPAVEGFDVGSQGAFFSLEIPWSCIDIYVGEETRPKHCGKNNSNKVWAKERMMILQQPRAWIYHSISQLVIPNYYS